MFKKYLLISIVFVMIGGSAFCLWNQHQTSSNYAQNYSRVVSLIVPPKMPLYMNIGNELYAQLFPSGRDNSRVRLAYGIPEIASGDISILADAMRETYKKFSADITLTGGVFANGESLIFQNVHAKFMTNSQSSKYYGFLDHLDLTGSLINNEMMIGIEKARSYIGKWWIYDQIGFMKTSTMKWTEGIENDNEIARSLFTAYFSLIQDLQTNEGFARLNKILVSHPIFVATATGMLVGDEYVYPVIFSSSGTMNLIEAFMTQYSGTGIETETRESLVKGLSALSGSGEFRVSTGKTPYFSLSGSIMMTTSTGLVNFNIIYHENETKITFSADENSMISHFTTMGDNTEYHLSITESGTTTNLINYKGIWSKDQKKIDLQFGKSPELFYAFFDLSKDGNWNTKIGGSDKESSGTIFSCNGKTRDPIQFNCDITPPDQDKVSIAGELAIDGKFTGELVTSVGTLTTDGHIMEDDILVNASSQGITVTFESKYNKDGTWNGKLQLPVATLKWNGKTNKEKLEDLHINLVSPISTARLNLNKEDDSVRGPFSISIQGIEVSSGTISMRKIPKYFNFRIDTILPDMTEGAFFEFYNFTDLTWDKNINIIEPENAISVFSGAFMEDIPKFQREYLDAKSEKDNQDFTR